MLKSLLRFSNTAARPVARSKLTMYHDPELLLSVHLLNRLQQYSRMPSTAGKYDHGQSHGQGQGPGVGSGATTFKMPWSTTFANSGSVEGKFEVETKAAPTYLEYRCIHEHCIGVHPDNSLSFERSFPLLFNYGTMTFCSDTARRARAQRKYVGDLEILSEEQFAELAARDEFFKGPLVIDWSNFLIANDDKGLDRIMANYLACGTQLSHHSFANVGVSSLGQAEVKAQEHRSMAANQDGSVTRVKLSAAIHPHVAEFADLF